MVRVDASATRGGVPVQDLTAKDFELLDTAAGPEQRRMLVAIRVTP